MSRRDDIISDAEKNAGVTCDEDFDILCDGDTCRHENCECWDRLARVVADYLEAARLKGQGGEMKNVTIPNDAAFACVDEGIHQAGLTKREYFAAMAMQGLMANPERYKYIYIADKMTPQGSITNPIPAITQDEAIAKNARKAVYFADELIEALNKEKK